MSILNKCGYNDSENNSTNKNQTSDTLKELANKAVFNKTKVPLYSLTSNQLRVYNQVKPKFGSNVQGWSEKSLELSKKKVIIYKNCYLCIYTK